MDSTYYQQLRVKYKQNTYWTLPIDYNNRPYLVQRLGDQSSLFEPKHVFLLHISTKVTCTNTSLNYSNSWHLVLQTCFTVKPIAFHCLYPCDAIPQTEETITMQILAHFGMCLQLIFTTLMNFKNFKKVVLGFNIT